MLINNGLFRDIDLENFEDWYSIVGLQFENLVLNNIATILKILKISPENLLSAAPYFQNTTKRQKGCQIDLLIQTKFTYYVCEIKFKNQIDSSIIDEMMEKIQRIKTPKTITLRPVLIYQGDLSKNVEKQNFFSQLINFAKLLQ